MPPGPGNQGASGACLSCKGCAGAGLSCKGHAGAGARTPWSRTLGRTLWAPLKSLKDEVAPCVQPPVRAFCLGEGQIPRGDRKPGRCGGQACSLDLPGVPQEQPQFPLKVMSSVTYYPPLGHGS